MPRSSAEYVDTVWYRISKGKPQPSAGVWRVAIQSTLDAALQRISDRVAADDGLYVLLFHEYDLTLSDGEVAINNLTPTLLVSRKARERWRVTMTGVTYPLKYRANRIDLDAPPPIQDFYYYTIFNNSLVVRDSNGSVPAEIDVQFFGNSVALIDDVAFDGELFDNLVDVGVAIIMESESLQEVVRQAETATASPSPAAAA